MVLTPASLLFPVVSVLSPSALMPPPRAQSKRSVPCPTSRRLQLRPLPSILSLWPRSQFCLVLTSGRLRRTRRPGLQDILELGRTCRWRGLSQNSPRRSRMRKRFGWIRPVMEGGVWEL
ncbi:hypothetical protein FPQ18DRAFT_315453 [Pyronema domesticum]|nr:hypothetical protein FPQ18DRAFT_315453 [Pyronema domesticum]